MSGAAFILAINLGVAGLFALAFLFISMLERSMVSSRLMAAGYATGMIYASLEFGIAAFDGSAVIVVAAYMAFAVALSLLNAGLASAYNVSDARWHQAVPLAFALAIAIVTIGWDRTDPLRNLLYQVPYALIQARGAWIVYRAERPTRLDRLFVGLLALSAAHYLLKPLVGVYYGVGATPEAYIGTVYAMVSQTSSVLFAVAVALTTLIVTMRSLLLAMERKSVTDTLSGVLNRRGFEERAQQLIETHQHSRLPLALVICDLDHFKTVNDTFGHHVGDLVIAAFGRQLSMSGTPGQVVGRVGGEEFAVILKGANMAMARLYAERVRASFSSMHIVDAPPGRSFTASFGVAELQPGERLVDLMARADAGLYLAKTAGRDCVRMAPPALMSKPEIVPGRSFRTHRAN